MAHPHPQPQSPLAATVAAAMTTVAAVADSTVLAASCDDPLLLQQQQQMLAQLPPLHALQPSSELFGDARAESELAASHLEPMATATSDSASDVREDLRESGDGDDAVKSSDARNRTHAQMPASRRTAGATGVVSGVVLQPLESLVALPEIERREFSSWTEFHAHLTEYSARTHQIYRTLTSTPVAKRNAGIKPTPYSRGRQLIPESFRQYAKTIACTHAGVARHRTRGLRPERASRCMGCPARMNACVRYTDHSGWRVHVTKHIAKHNHAVERDMFVQYPENRRVTDPDVLRTVNVLRRVGTDPQKILEYIHEDTTARPTLDDVVALLAKMKRDAEDAAREAQELSSAS